MTAEISEITVGKRRPIFLNILWAGFAIFVILVIIAHIAVEIVPHKRGIEFVPQLRYAVITPLCLISASGAAFFYQILKKYTANPQLKLTVCLCILAIITLALTYILGSTGLLTASMPAVVAVALTLGWLVPYFIERPRGRIFTGLIVLLGALEIAGLVAAISSEIVQPDVSPEMAFDIPQSLFDVNHKFMTLSNGARIHYVDEGAGETLLFLHGNPAWSFQWRDLIGGLRGKYRCVALDYPGFGLSTAPPGYGFTAREQSRMLEEFVDRLELRDITFVMQDWGGPIGLGLAGRRPELVRRIVLGNTWAWVTNVSEVRGKFSLIAGGPIGEFVQMNFNGFVPFAVSNGVVRELPEDVVEMYTRPFRPLNRRGVAAFYPGQITADSDYMNEVEAGLSRIGNRKTLVFWGMRDIGFPRADLERFEKVFPNHKTIELPDADHFFFEDAAPKIVSEINLFVSDK